jgi:phage gp36-like protein
MPYITRTEFEKRFGAVELDDLTAENDFNAAASDADALVDGYLAARYSLPLSSVPTLVEGWAADITRFKLWDDHAPEEVRKRYEDALAQLKLLAQGVISLPPGADGKSPTTEALNVGGYSADRVFTQDSLREF